MVNELTYFSLIVRAGEGAGTVFPLKQGSNVIGRWDPESRSLPDIDLEKLDVAAKISRSHAKVSVNGQQVTVEDLGSLNGTEVNKSQNLVPGVKCYLEHGDEVIVGKIVFKLEESVEPAQASK